MKKRIITIVYILGFIMNLNSQTLEYKRPGLSLQFTAIEYAGTYHFPTNYRWFDSQIQYEINNGQLDIYRKNLKKIIVINSKADSVNIIQNAGLMLNQALESELAIWSSLEKINKRKKKINVLKFDEREEMGDIKKRSIYILTYEDFMASKKLSKLVKGGDNDRISLKTQLEIVQSNEDSYFFKYIDGSIILVGNNQRSTLYGIFDILTKIERQKPLTEIEQPASTLPKYRLANLWDGIDKNESESFLSKEKVFYSVYNAGTGNSVQFIYEKLAQMLAFYNINGIVISGGYDVFIDRYSSALKLFSHKMKEYGIEMYLEVTAAFAEDNQELIDEYFTKNKGFVKGLVISSLNLYGRKGDIHGGSAIAKLLVGKGYTVIWRDEQVNKEGENRKKIMFKNTDVENLDEKVIKESINVNPGKYKNTLFGPADIIGNTLVKSYALHWKGSDPYADYQFPDEKTDIAFLIYFYTKESKQIVQIIDNKINKVKP
ncbi:MAG: hypothetical protein DRI95_16040 [Bacteroidetes bacterium]|nr:MAG: hypothetical protein DRI95_16040 [Bacteroidota bacterium]